MCQKLFLVYREVLSVPAWHLSQLPEHLVDGEAATAEAADSLEPSIPEPLQRVESREHNVFTHFPKDRNYAKGPKLQMVPCRKRTRNQIPRAENNVGDLMTAEHKVLNEECESRNSHSYAVIVQDLATQWLQANPCKTKSSQETEESLQKDLEPKASPKVIYTDNSLEFGEAPALPP